MGGGREAEKAAGKWEARDKVAGGSGAGVLGGWGFL